MITDYIIVTGCTERSETAMAPESRPAGMVPPLSPLKTETPSKPITQLRDAVLKQLKEGYTPHGSPYATGGHRFERREDVPPLRPSHDQNTGTGTTGPAEPPMKSVHQSPKILRLTPNA